MVRMADPTFVLPLLSLRSYNTPMHVISLQSGSNGNCIYVEAGGVRLLFDTGISGSRAKDVSSGTDGIFPMSMPC